VGSSLKVKFNIRGNAWQDKYFVNLQAWMVEAGDAADDFEGMGEMQGFASHSSGGGVAAGGAAASLNDLGTGFDSAPSPPAADQWSAPSASALLPLTPLPIFGVPLFLPTLPKLHRSHSVLACRDSCMVISRINRSPLASITEIVPHSSVFVLASSTLGLFAEIVCSASATGTGTSKKEPGTWDSDEEIKF